MSDQDFLLVTTTSDQREVLDAISKSLVEKNLAACCQVSGPVTSHYRWQGETESSNEWVCSIKTVRQHFESVCDTITELHHYDLPEIVSVNIDSGSQAYLDWLRTQTTRKA